MVLKWEAILIALLVFLVVFLTVRIVSVGSLAAALTLVGVQAVELYALPAWAPAREVFVFSVLAAGLVFVKHRTNIRRLLAGEEKRLALGKGSS